MARKAKYREEKTVENVKCLKKPHTTNHLTAISIAGGSRNIGTGKYVRHESIFFLICCLLQMATIEWHYRGYNSQILKNVHTNSVIIQP